MHDSVSGPHVQVDNLKCWFPVARGVLDRLKRSEKKYVRAVDGVSFAIEHGRTLALIGESGCGKSTVARAIVGLHQPSGGEISIRGAGVPDRKRRGNKGVQLIFQDPFSSLNPRWSVFDIISEPLKLTGSLSRKQIDLRVGELLAKVGLSPSDASKYPHEFSGGQRQRVSIARALASEPELLVCDEPTSALDVSVQAQIINLLSDLQRESSLTCLFISHNLAVVRQTADKVAVMYLGRIVEMNDADALFSRPAHPYTRGMLEALPDIDSIGLDRSPIPGEIPNAIAPPTGCAFHPRCFAQNDRCRVEAPSLKSGPYGKVACHAIEEGRLAINELAASPGYEGAVDEPKAPALALTSDFQADGQTGSLEAVRGRSAFRSRLFESFMSAPAVMFASLLLLVIMLGALSASIIAPHEVLNQKSFNLMDASTPPVWASGGVRTFLLGTDQQGRDVLSAILFGLQISLIIGVASTLLAVLIGVVVGLVSGYLGGKLDAILMRAVDVQLSFPAILVAILVNGVARLAVAGPGQEKLAIYVLILSIGVTGWMQFARTVRASTMVEAHKEYVQAAVIIGRSKMGVMFNHILPNVLGPVLVLATIFLGVAILTEASLSFLGMGLPPDQPSLGTLIRVGGNYLFSGEWWVVIFPGLTLAVLILTVNIVGDRLRDILNPRLN